MLMLSFEVTGLDGKARFALSKDWHQMTARHSMVIAISGVDLSQLRLVYLERLNKTTERLTLDTLFEVERNIFKRTRKTR